MVGEVVMVWRVLEVGRGEEEGWVTGEQGGEWVGYREVLH